MKRKCLLWIILLVGLLIFNSCKKVEPEKGDDAGTTAAPAVTEVGVPAWEQTLTALFENGLDYQMGESQNLKAIPYEVSSYVYNVQDHPVVSLSEIYNKGQFIGFTKGQETMLLKNGFVVLQPNANYAHLKMHEINEFAEYGELPQFISTDVVLHLYHVFYSESLKGLEKKHYFPELVTLSEHMLQKSLAAHRFSTERSAPEAAQKTLESLIAYFAVGQRLLEPEATPQALPADLEALVQTELDRIRSATERADSEVFGQVVDYSQYTVRGHYNSGETLSRYFRAMMWYGQAGFKLTDGAEIKLDEVRKALTITYLMHCDTGEAEGDMAAWDKIYNLTSLYSGPSDDLSVRDLWSMMGEVYGETLTLDKLFDTHYDEALESGVKALRSPGIVMNMAKLDPDMPLPKEFRFFGQRYTLDGEIMQRLMMPNKRPVPTSFDVLTAFGHPKAETVLRAHYETDQQWPEYNSVLKALKKKVAELPIAQWQQDLYHGWLWGIDAAAKDFEGVKGIPYFMGTEAWSYKNLSSALGSFAELKHDNVLYSKQPVAEAGGPMYQPLNYVEPNVEVYSRLKWLSVYTRENLKVYGIEDPEVVESLDDMIELMGNLEAVSIKELAGETITEEENRKLTHVGGLIDAMTFNLTRLAMEGEMDFVQKNTTALVSDVATVFGAGYVELGVGLPHELYVLCESNGLQFIARGVVYSPYEFVSDERLTDETWQTMLGIVTEELEYGTMASYDVSKKSLDLLEIMPWLAIYISDEPNHVESPYVEYDWNHEVFN